MGSAARKLDQSPRASGTALRAVPAAGRRPASRRGLRRSAIRSAVVVSFALLVLAGGARVTLAAQAAEASYRAWDLQSQVEAEQQMQRTLAAEVGALSSPSRIAALASETLRMSRPSQVNYIALPAGTGQALAATDADGAAPAEGAQSRVAEGGSLSGGSTKGSVLASTLLDLAAREAQVMLVGDMGLGPAE